ncbi:MAG TPA: benzoate-CoA ligase family protein [Burkholderiales bacterium]|nr:benzoate-CoA ligase family protein [Burkholderiales bacterium]
MQVVPVALANRVRHLVLFALSLPGHPSMIPKRSIVDYVAEHARRAPGRAALHYQDRVVDYGRLEEASARCRGALAELGVQPGERVALLMHDSPEMVVALLAIMGMGAVAVPCNPLQPVEGLTYVLQHSGTVLVIASDELVPLAQSAGAARIVSAPGELDAMLQLATPAPLAAFDAATPCLLMYTSGSTGHPKGVVHRHGDLPFSVEHVARDVHGLQPEDRLFSVARLFFAYGLGNSFTVPLGAGASSILLGERPTAALIASVFEKYRPTVFFAVPTAFRMLLEHVRQGNRLDTAALRFAVSAGEVLPLATWNEWKSVTGTEILESIGTTEMLYAFIHNRPGRNRPGSSGEVVGGYEAQLLDDAGKAVPGEGRGSLVVRGGSATPGYWNDPERTAEAIRDGWVRTGDVYRRDADGYYWFEGRSDDLFKCSGMWVSPGEVEAAVVAHPAVVEAAVIAESDAQGGTIPAAYVLLRPGQAAGDRLAAEIMARAAEALPRFKRPQRIHFMDQLPRTPTGKVQRYKLRELSRRR